MEFAKIPARQVPISSRSEVVVIGGGVAGISAAVSSARLGCKTILIEDAGFLGGTVTKCLMPSVGQGRPALVQGIFAEVFGRLRKAGALLESEGPSHTTPFDPEIFKAICFDFIEESGIELLLHTRVIDVIKEFNRLSGVLISNKSGIQSTMGEVIIDTSGDADVAALAGESFETDGEQQPMSLMFIVGNADPQRFAEFVQNYPDKSEFWPMGGPRDMSIIEVNREKPRINVGGFHGLIKKAREKGELYLPHDNMALVFLPMKGTVFVNATHVRNLNPISGTDLTLAEIESRKQMASVFVFLKDNIPGFENIFLMSSGSHIGVRESRRLTGEYVLQFEDIQNARPFEDTVAMYWGRASIHGPGEKQTFISFPKPYYIPYRILQAKMNENLLVAGRCVSADHFAHGAVRSIAPSFATGQAAGTAAALSIKNRVKPKNLDINLLQQALIRQGVILSSPV